MRKDKNETTFARDAARVLKPLRDWRHRCHEASLKLVQAGIGTRVARGLCPGVGGQHSWVVVGMDCYNPIAIIDPTLWSYTGGTPKVYFGQGLGHRPHGAGTIWNYGQPVNQGGPTIVLTPKTPLSRHARLFLDMIEPLDMGGWMALTGAPVGGWPAAEIIAAMDDTKELSALIPIDKLGMLTDRNPDGLYLKASRS